MTESLTVDIAILGGGMAGFAAAVTARRAGKDVALICQSPGATALSSGCVDFAPASSEGATIAASVETLAAARPAHPFAVIASERARAVHAAVELLGREFPFLAGGADGRPLLLATPMGAVRDAAMAQKTIALGDLQLLRGARIGVVALAGVQALEARLVASLLDESLASRGGSATLLTVPLFVQRSDAQLLSSDFAADVERPGRAAEWGRAIGLAARQCGATHALISTVGLVDPVSTLEVLTQGAGVRCFEQMSGPPSVPGLRLQRAIDARLSEIGVRVISGVATAAISGDTVQAIQLGSGERVNARAFVLASGKFLSGGITREATFQETVFGLPVHVPGARGTWIGDLLDRDPAGEHAALAAGVATDSMLRPLDADGAVRFPNLFAAGAILAGSGATRDQSGLGLAAATGWLAAQGAMAFA